MSRDKDFEAGRNKSNATRAQLKADRQVLFLSALAECGPVSKALELSGVSRSSYKTWHAQDIEFANNVAESRHIFAESLEGIALERVKNPDRGRGSDMLVIALLNANMPQKYRPQIAMNEDTAKDLIAEWRKASKEVSRERSVEEKELSAPVEQTLVEILERRGSAPEKPESEE